MPRAELDHLLVKMVRHADDHRVRLRVGDRLLDVGRPRDALGLGERPRPLLGARVDDARGRDCAARAACACRRVRSARAAEHRHAVAHVVPGRMARMAAELRLPRRRPRCSSAWRARRRPSRRRRDLRRRDRRRRRRARLRQATRASPSRRCSRATARIRGSIRSSSCPRRSTQVVGANGQRQAMAIERIEGLAATILANFRLRPSEP